MGVPTYILNILMIFVFAFQISAYIATAVSAHCRRDYSVTGVTSGNTVHATRGSQEQNTDVLKLKGNSSGNVPNVPGMTRFV